MTSHKFFGQKGQKQSKEYAVTGLSINQDIDSRLIAVKDTNRQEAISNLIQKLVIEKKDPDLDLKICNEEAFEKIIPFEKKTESEVPPIKITFYNTTTKKQQEVEFYNYMLHLEKYGFRWEDTSLEFKYSVRPSTNKKGLIKKISMQKSKRKKLFLDESRVWSFAVDKMERKQLRDYFFGYFFHTNAVESYFRINLTNTPKDLAGLTNLEKNWYMRFFDNSDITSECFLYHRNANSHP